MTTTAKIDSYVRIYIQEDSGPLARFGRGWRTFVVFNPGRVWIHLLSPATLRVAKVRRTDYDGLGAVPCAVPPAQLAADLTTKADRRARQGGTFRHHEQVRAVADALTGAAA